MSVTFKIQEQVEKHQSCYTRNLDLAETEIPLKKFFNIFNELDTICKIGVAFPEKFDHANRFRHAMLRYTK